MIPVLTAAQMREADRRTIEEIGLPGAVLMENAGSAVASRVRHRHPDVRRPLVLCGRGNNGGDGFVVARRLESLAPMVLLMGRREGVKGDARIHLGAMERTGVPLTEVPDEEAWTTTSRRLWEADLVVDALLGTGLTSAPSGLIARVIADLESMRSRRNVPVIAVDMPSGLSSDAGEVPGHAVSAQCTVTFAAPKCGHVLPPACDRVGDLHIAEIGIPQMLLESAARLWLIEPKDVAEALPERQAASHKGDYGHVLVLGGSLGRTGAALLAAQGALRCGAGLATVASARCAQPILAAANAEIMTEGLSHLPDGTLTYAAAAEALALAGSRDVAVVGPGLGQGSATRAVVREVISRCAVPLVVDADGLNALAARDGESGATALLRRERPTIVTPHPGEMARLLGTSVRDVQQRRLEVARTVAVETGAIVVLKGHRTVVADAGGRAAINPTGNPGMATGGAGDVLAGMMGALLARGCDPWLAAIAATYLHGRAGDCAARRCGQESLTALEILASLPEALESVRGREVHP